jgi:hypothetical protein
MDFLTNAFWLRSKMANLEASTLLGEVGFSHNTLQQQESLAAKGIIVGENAASDSLGRPKFAYHVPSRATKQVTSAIQDPHVGLVSLQFSRLRHVCRFENGGYCKETRKSCSPQNCPPKNQKIRIKSILDHLGTAMRATRQMYIECLNVYTNMFIS